MATHFDLATACATMIQFPRREPSKRLAREGANLTRFYASASICSPSRAPPLTGRCPHSVGVPELCSPEARSRVPILALDHEAVTPPKPYSRTATWGQRPWPWSRLIDGLTHAFVVTFG